MFSNVQKKTKNENEKKTCVDENGEILIKCGFPRDKFNNCFKILMTKSVCNSEHVNQLDGIHRPFGTGYISPFRSRWISDWSLMERLWMDLMEWMGWSRLIGKAENWLTISRSNQMYFSEVTYPNRDNHTRVWVHCPGFCPSSLYSVKFHISLEMKTTFKVKWAL